MCLKVVHELACGCVWPGNTGTQRIPCRNNPRSNAKSRVLVRMKGRILNVQAKIFPISPRKQDEEDHVFDEGECHPGSKVKVLARTNCWDEPHDFEVTMVTADKICSTCNNIERLAKPRDRRFDHILDVVLRNGTVEQRDWSRKQF